MSSTLFDDELSTGESIAASSPLADRMRPLSLDEVVGQAVVGPRGYLRKAIRDQRIPSLIIWGPPGSGKTTIARIIASEVPCRFVPFSAVTSGIKEVREVMAGISLNRKRSGRRTILFVDEIHRFNRAQQDAFLPYVERGDIVLIGATTENPSFHVNAALMSRCRPVVLKPLTEEDLAIIVSRALTDSERGLGDSGARLADSALETLIRLSSGDARRALNLLELVVQDLDESQGVSIEADAVTRVAQQKVLLYDKSGEEHFNLISALHKSIREGDPDASIYWLARMLHAGEDPNYLARRMLRIASEDVGLADPDALARTIAAWESYSRLGSPEGELALAQAALYLALAPKSNSTYEALARARRAVEEKPAEPVPMALRNAPTKLMEQQGYGRGYVSSHSVPEGVTGLACLPKGLENEQFYTPRDRGHEMQIARHLTRFRLLRERLRAERETVDRSKTQSD